MTLTRRAFLGAIPFAATVRAATRPRDAARNGKPSGMPNVVVILADDMGYGDVGCYNAESKIPTPNMDRLATQGMRFTDAHSPSSVCTPTRYGVLTGRYCWRTRLKRSVLFNYEPPLIEPKRMTVASLLRERGYVTGMVGKWHLGLGFTAKKGRKIDFNKPLPWHPGPEPDRTIGESIDFAAPVQGGPSDLGFDYAFYTAGCSTDHEPFCFIENRRFLGMEKARYRHPAGSWRSGMTAEGWVNETVDVTFTEKAVGFIRDARKRSPDKPFFLYLPLSAPHSPHLVPDVAKGKSKAGARGDLVWLVDWSVGKIMAALDEMGVTDNTLLIVTSDNGPLVGSLAPAAPERTATMSGGHRAAGDLRGFKGRLHEGGHRVPFIARWPGKISRGSTSDELICLTDLLATCAAVAESELPKNAGEDSVDILPALLSRKRRDPVRDSVVHHSSAGAFALRKGKWKILFGEDIKGRIRPTDASTGVLYNLRDNPRETTNVWRKHPEVVRELTALLKTIRTSGRSRP